MHRDVGEIAGWARHNPEMAVPQRDSEASMRTLLHLNEQTFARCEGAAGLLPDTDAHFPYHGAVSEIEQSPGSNPVATPPSTDLERFEESVHSMLAQAGLPVEKLFVPVNERKTLVATLPGVLERLDAKVLDRSHYISKMIAAATVGLFDAALNYLWDELVSELRRRVAGFDLKYFFDIAAGANADLRKGLRSEEDLTKLDDNRLLSAALSIGLLTDTGYQRLDHIRFMRNHASAAHPNQATLTGLDLASWLQICITEVINTPPDTVTANTGRLLANIKKAVLDKAAVDAAAAFFDQLPHDRAATLANGLFGLYTDPGRTVIVADNIRILWPKLWPFVAEETRSGYGLRHARALASAETKFATAARELINLVSGSSYLTLEVRAVEMADALDALDTAHGSFNNFYNEPAPARRVAELAGEQGDVPEAIRPRYVRSVTEYFLGNGFGVSSAAATHYEKMLKAFAPGDAGIALRLFLDLRVSSLLRSTVGRQQWAKVLEILEPKLTSTRDRNLMNAVRAFTGPLESMRLDTGIKKLTTATTP